MVRSTRPRIPASQQQARPRLQIMALETRVLFDGAISPSLAPLAQNVLIPLSEVRSASAEVQRVELPRDPFAPFSPERILGVIQDPAESARTAADAARTAAAEAAKTAAADAAKTAAVETKPAQDDCVATTRPGTETAAPKLAKPQAVRPSVFARDGIGAEKNFSAQVGGLKKAFKPPVKLQAGPDGKNC